MKRFELRGNVHDVGLRMELIGIGMSYNLKVSATNVEGENQVNIIAVGEERDIQKFHEHVGSTDARINKEGPIYETTSLRDDNGPEPDWTYETLKFVMEQLRKGAFEFFQIKKLLQELVEKKKKRVTRSKRKSRRKSR